MTLAVAVGLPSREVVVLPRHVLPRRPAAALLHDGWGVLLDARVAATADERYSLAHLAALRGAAAVLAVRARPAPGRTRLPVARRSAWSLLAAVAPELGEWAAFFASGAAKRVAAESGLAGAVTTREADDLVRDTETFLSAVTTLVSAASGRAYQTGFPGSSGETGFPGSSGAGGRSGGR
jgi:hypothetical protein